MKHKNILEREKTALVVIDIQEKLRPNFKDFDALIKNIKLMQDLAKILEIPIIIIEHQPEKLGETCKQICMENCEKIIKTSFSAGPAGLIEKLKTLKIKQVLLCGVEAQVCVNQTAHDLLANGFPVHLLLDAISSSSQFKLETAVKKMLASGAIPCCIEMAAFELMESSESKYFKEVYRRLKQNGSD